MVKIDLPVILFIYKRIDTTLRILEQIKQAQIKKLYIFADGAKNIEENSLIENARNKIDRFVRGMNVEKYYLDHNVGGPAAIVTGLDWVFSTEEYVLLLEDDDYPHATFFPFISELLERYVNDERVMLINGGNKGIIRQPHYSYFFDRHPLALTGLGIWKRFWKRFDAKLVQWKIPATKQRIKKTFSSAQRYLYLCSYWDMLADGTYRSWDFTLLYNLYLSGGFCINPTVNMVENIGFDNYATKTIKKNPFIHYPKAQGTTFPLSHPEEIIPVTGSDKLIQKKKFGLLPMLGKIIMKIK
ncbi:MAG: hypothetical protein JW822_01500 [Spirochaetales bacterium]|nr:hypothetical protein [Spirochaetales bacterium]